ncbi:hypothetical protein CAQU_05800 [Corynebacterium aquilae DSM 44791]|uniref:Uncharacterized protein n=1 Tax=Corynebacterium aquilae DSM 44791 TaxID=1431546 RepID=A0A1L7CFL7_9CORY|nr:hypothetical protein CAQU_05800 [Corynebacterium aquilae DSM 44791]
MPSNAAGSSTCGSNCSGSEEDKPEEEKEPGLISPNARKRAISAFTAALYVEHGSASAGTAVDTAITGTKAVDTTNDVTRRENTDDEPEVVF